MIFGFGGAIKQAAPNNADASAPPPLAPSLIAAGLVCAFGLWSAPALLLVYTGLTTPALTATTAFLLMALTGLTAVGLRLLLGFLLTPRDEPGLLLMLLLSLLGFGGVLLFLQGEYSLRAFVCLALLAGIGGGGFASLSGSVYSTAKSVGHTLEASTSVGHLGIIVGLLVLPWLVTITLPRQLPACLRFDASHFLGRVDAGTAIWPSWVGLFWGALGALILLLWALYRPWYRPGVGRQAFKVAGIILLGLSIAGLCAIWLLYAVVSGWPLWLRLLPVLLLPVLCLLALKVLLPTQRWQLLWGLRQHRHLWVMSLLWAASLGSFLGFTLAFAELSTVLFRPARVELGGPGYPGVFLYAWMLPLAALLMRPLGAWLARRWGGTQVSLWCFVALALAAFGAGHYSRMAYGAAYPPAFFMGYIASFSVLFVAAGLAHAALVQSLPIIFPPCLQANSSTWLIAMATVGMTYIPLMLSNFANTGFVLAFNSFAVFYSLCALLCGALYLRRHSFIYHP
jgi:nitrate/nitrite transporter NarK